MSGAPAITSAREAILRWTAGLGAITAEALAARERSSVPSARARLIAAERAGLLRRRRPLTEQPALYTVTRQGMRASGLRGLEACRITAANARHLIACAEAAAGLEACYPDHRVLGERELRREERERGEALASAPVRGATSGHQRLHRPDLVLVPLGDAGGLPVAVEVELSLKAPRRLADICLAWARCRGIAGVLYLAAPEVEQALARAVASVDGEDRIVVVPLHALPRPRAETGPPPRTVAADI